MVIGISARSPGAVNPATSIYYVSVLKPANELYFPLE